MSHRHALRGTKVDDVRFYDDINTARKPDLVPSNTNRRFKTVWECAFFITMQ